MSTSTALELSMSTRLLYAAQLGIKIGLERESQTHRRVSHSAKSSSRSAM
jgi:hypothetical protein